ncbi:MAG: MFS transporter [Candidatus Solibacter usitatus]|nr:MFS transporter [Candidatus Solibacter usitatus]
MSLWRNPEFLKLWVGQTISEIGSRVTTYGLPLMAVTTLRATPSQMGMLSAAGGFAAIIASPFAGLAADRFRRKPVLWITDLARAAILFVIPLSAWQGWISLPVLFAVMAAASCFTVFFDAAYQSILPSMVGGRQLLEGNSKLAMTQSGAEVIGPALAGVLVQLYTAPRAILLDSLSFLVSAASILWMRVPESKPVSASEPSEGWKEMFSGIPYIFRHPILRPLALRAITAYFCFGSFVSLYFIFTVHDLGLSAAAIGVIISLGGVSNLFGATVSGYVANRFPVGLTLIGSTIFTGLQLLLVPLANGPFWAPVLLSASQLVGDLAFPIYQVTELTVRQRVADPALLGRVNAFMQMLAKGVLPAGALAGGYAASLMGVRMTLVLADCGIVLSALWLLFSDVKKMTSMRPARELAPISPREGL